MCKRISCLKLNEQLKYIVWRTTIKRNRNELEKLGKLILIQIALHLVVPHLKRRWRRRRWMKKYIAAIYYLKLLLACTSPHILPTSCILSDTIPFKDLVIWQKSFFLPQKTQIVYFAGSSMKILILLCRGTLVEL